jgi:transposase InsO family protein
MDLHQNARSCPASRELLVKRVTERGWTVRAAAEALGVSERSAYRWLARYRQEGTSGLEDRTSCPQNLPHKTPKKMVMKLIQLRLAGLTGGEIAARTGVPRSTVGRWLNRAGMGRLKRLAPPEPIRRYEKKTPGELLHLDVKKLGKIGRAGHRVTGDKRKRARGVGWEFVHVAIDDASRLAYVEILDNERAATAIAFLKRAIAWFARQGVRTLRLLTDNGSCYVARTFAAACETLSLKHSRTRPYRPRTNGKAERFIQTLLREWAYAFTFNSSAERGAMLPIYLHFYNWHREHSALGRQPPGSRLNMNNVVGNDS